MKVVCIAVWAALAGSGFAQSTAPVPVTTPGQNWGLPHWHTLNGEDCLNAVCLPASNQMGITFTLPGTDSGSGKAVTSWNHTSAAIYNASGNLIKHLWYNRAYPAGVAQGTLWDGNDDYGNAATGSPYTAKIEYDNVVRNWDGVIGNTSSSWGGPYDWDQADTLSPSIAFLNGTGYAATYYNEGNVPAVTFPESAPNALVLPFPNTLFLNAKFAYAATDGNLIYFATTPLNDPAMTSYVAAFYPGGQLYGFANGAAVTNQCNNYNVPHRCIPSFTVVDNTAFPAGQITGLAVQTGGSLLATAHGVYYYGLTTPEAGLNQVNVFNKTTGAAVCNVSIPNPQLMAFDLGGNLWVISGNAGFNGTDTLYEVSGVCSSNTITTPIGGLGNPVAVAVSPTTGNLFVADGGAHQQIYEYNATTYALVSTLGQLGGYGNASTCNATIDPQGPNVPTFYFDPNFVGVKDLTLQTAFVANNIQMDDHGDLWVTDHFRDAILHYTKTGGSWAYVNRIMYQPYNYRATVAPGAPTRVFAGPVGLLEYAVNYSVPLLPGDPEAAGGNGSWDVVRNWYPCVMQQVPSTSYPGYLDNRNTATFSNGTTYLYPFSEKTFSFSLALNPHTNGVLTYEVVGSSFPGGAYLDNAGNYYTLSGSGSGPYTYRIYESPTNGFDANGFPTWGSSVQLASFTADPTQGQPRAANTQLTYNPSTGGVVPVFEVNANTIVTGTTPAFHIGFLQNGGTSLFAMSMPQNAKLLYPDGDGSFPAATYAGIAQLGTNTYSLNHDIFAFINGNWGYFGCQFFQYRDDGMFLGQFGWQTSYAFQQWGTWGPQGVGNSTVNQPRVPGFCGDVGHPMYTQVGSDYYVFVGDEGYHEGTHRWHIANLASVHEATATGTLGSTVGLSQTF
jgi:hypothetical protein